MATYIPIAPQPGIVTDISANSAEGRWIDGDRVRFRDGFPETIGGWSPVTNTPFLGTCRKLWTWVTLLNQVKTAIGTNLKAYVEEGGSYLDITPIRSTTTLGSNPIATQGIGSGIVVITHNSHGAQTNDFVTISGATAVGGITTAQLNKEHQITRINANSYSINTGGSASSVTTGGGASVSASYQINTGSDVALIGTGWGAGTWGRGTWGSASTSAIVSNTIRLWSMENWGEDLLISPRDGGLYYWDSSTVNRATAVTAGDTPTKIGSFLVSPNERIVMAFACNPIGSTTQDLLLVRWSDYEDYQDWTPTSSNAAGGVRLNVGSQIICAVRAQNEILVWTDQALFAFTFVGGQDIFQVRLVDENIDIAGPNAAVAMNGAVYWVGRNNFYVYDGRVRTLPCTIKSKLRDVNFDQRYKIFGGPNSLFEEVIWFYPSASSSENNKYIMYDTDEGTWSFGNITRTAWIDSGIRNYPRAAGTDRILYFHEFGADDKTPSGTSPLNAYIESAPFELSGGEIGRGDKFYFVNEVIPDVDFRESTGSPTLTMTFKRKRYPGGSTRSSSKDVDRSVTVGEWTESVGVRLRGRSLAVRFSSNETGTMWRLGTNRISIRTDGSQ